MPDTFDAAEKLEELRKKWQFCTACPLNEERSNVVFGEGNPDADILVIGEAPGDKENRSGRPFYGPSGRVLDRFLRHPDVDLDREHDLYVTNVVGCRPTSEEANHKGDMQIVDRKPSKVEKLACRPRLLEIIYLVDPLLIITVGLTPAQAVLGKVPAMRNLRGIIHTLRLQGRHEELTYPVMPIFHTAFLLRDHNRRGDGPWGQTASDMTQVKNIVRHLRQVYGR
jgi:DNA polymerase